jgi:hypothetical protein
MQLEVVPFKPTQDNSNVWRVTATGYGGDADSANSETVYQGPSEIIAKRIHLEVLALERLFPNGRGGGEEYNYSYVLAGLFEENEAKSIRGNQEPHKPFAWATECWSEDVNYRDESRDATIDGSVVEWINEHGAACKVKVGLSASEQALLDSVPPVEVREPYDLSALVSLIESVELQDQTPLASKSARRQSI